MCSFTQPWIRKTRCYSPEDLKEQHFGQDAAGGFLFVLDTSTGVQLKAREVSCWNKSHRSCCSFSAKSEAINNGRGFAGNGNKKQCTSLCQMLPKPFHAFKCQGINDTYWQSTNQGINRLLQRPGLKTLRGILGLLLFLPWHSAWVSTNPGKPSHSSLPGLTH